MRPQSIIRFEQLYLAGTAVGAINLVVNYETMAQRAGAVGGGVVLAGAAIGWVAVFLFWYFVARRASNVAKWILVAMTALGLTGITRISEELAAFGGIYIALTALTTLLQLAAIWFLFQRDAVKWLKSRGQQGPIDVTTFN